MPNTIAEDADEAAETCIVTSSKGLAEMTKSKNPTVQFIHESVRDFLVKDGGLAELWPNLGLDWETQSHNNLKKYCIFYLNQKNVEKAISKSPGDWDPENLRLTNVLRRKRPFLEYASQHVLYHADVAAETLNQENFLKDFDTLHWVSILNQVGKSKIRRYTKTTRLMYILADRGHSRLIRAQLNHGYGHGRESENYVYPLFTALAKGYKDVVVALLESSFIVTDRDLTSGLGLRSSAKMARYKHYTPLSWAASRGFWDIVMLLLCQKSKFDLSNGIARSEQVLETEHYIGVPVFVERMLKLAFEAFSDTTDQCRDSVRNVLSGKHQTPPTAWPVLDRRRVDPRGIEQLVKLEDVLELLVKYEVDDIARERNKARLLFFAAEVGDLPKVELVMSIGIDTNIRNSEGETPLFVAVSHRHDPVARFLLMNGADANLATHSRTTPLESSIHVVSATSMKLLLEHGADPNTRALDGRPLLAMSQAGNLHGLFRLLLDAGADVRTATYPLHQAVRFSLKATAMLLFEGGIDVNARDDRSDTALHLTAYHAFEYMMATFPASEVDVQHGGDETLTSTSVSESMAGLLIEKGADVNAVNMYGVTPLSLACRSDRESLVRLLITHGARSSLDLGFSSTPLHDACRRGNEVIIRSLLQNGADINARNENNDTPLALALRKGHVSIARLLIGNGADTGIQTWGGRTLFDDFQDLQRVQRGRGD